MKPRNFFKVLQINSGRSLDFIVPDHLMPERSRICRWNQIRKYHFDFITYHDLSHDLGPFNFLEHVQLSDFELKMAIVLI
jgi:hypothetical protein